MTKFFHEGSDSFFRTLDFSMYVIRVRKLDDLYTLGQERNCCGVKKRNGLANENEINGKKVRI